MAINYTNKIDIRGKEYEPILGDILFKNKTVDKGLVAFEDNVKASTIFTENSNTVSFQSYTVGTPSDAGSINLTDVEITPVKVMVYKEFSYDDLRTSRFKKDMSAGAWNTLSGDFEKLVINGYAANIAQEAESMFWNGSTAATKTAVAAAGTASYTANELAYVSGSTTKLIDGVVTKMLTTGGHVKVAGTTITSSNIAAEYAKIYAAIPSNVINSIDGKPFIYAPYSHKQLINVANIGATYRDVFAVDMVNDKYMYNGIEIQFVQLPANVVIAALPSNLVWCTDLFSDLGYIQIDKVANNSDMFFLKAVFTQYAHVARKALNVLYI